MGHDSEATTQIYLASLETSVVDRSYKMIFADNSAYFVWSFAKQSEKVPRQKSVSILNKVYFA